MPTEQGQGGPIRAALIGTGMISEVHQKAIQSAGGRIVAIMGPDTPAVEAAAARWGAQACSTLEELFAAQPDVVHVVSPNATHFEHAMAVMERGLNVVCEKPLGTSLEQAQTMAATAKAKGIVATVPFAYRFHPMVREIKARLERGELGALALIHGSYLQDWMVPLEAGGWRVSAEVGGKSRAFADIGSHWCDLVEWVSGQKLARLTALAKIVHPSRTLSAAASFSTSQDADARQVQVDTEDVAMVTAQTTEGIPVNTVISQVSPGRKNRLWFELDATEGSAVFDQERSEEAWFGGLEEERVVKRGSPSPAPQQARLNRLPAGHAMGYQDCFNALVADTYAAIGGRVDPDLPTFEDGLRAAQIADAVLTSFASQTWVDVAGKDGRSHG